MRPSWQLTKLLWCGRFGTALCVCPAFCLSCYPVVQKNPSDAASYFSRRMAMMKEQLDKAYGVLNQKRQLFEAVSHLLQNKLEAAQAAQAQAGAQSSA